MGKLTVIDRIKYYISCIAFNIFLWTNSMTDDEYWTAVWEQEERYRKTNNE